MSIRYTIVTIGSNGQREERVEEIAASEVIIGRGGGANVIVTGRDVSREHTRIFTQSGAVLVEDLHSLSGTRVNGRSVRTQTLQDGDTVQIGEHLFAVTIRGDGFALMREVQPAPDQAHDESQDSVFSFSTWIRSATLLGVALVVASFLYGVFASVQGGDFGSSGELANVHSGIADCTTCHEAPFAFVQDESCLGCHEVSAHAPRYVELQSKHTELEQPCRSCHFEHRGDSGPLQAYASHQAAADGNCVSCHGEPKRFSEHLDVAAVLSWGQHPDFYVNFKEVGKDEPLRLKQTKELKEPSKLKLNHAVHLKPDLRGPDGFVTLGCRDCHRMNPRGETMMPVDFERDCHSCHLLEFDERLPGREVPHGQPDEVFRYAYSEYAKLYLEDQRSSPATSRLRPGEPPPVEERTRFVKSSLVAEASEAEKRLFTKLACTLCHSVKEVSEVSGELEPRYTIEKPTLQNHFFARASFRHAAHEFTTCESCHGEVQDSEASEDLLLPTLTTCQSCHGTEAGEGKVASPCMQCHPYHRSEPLPFERKRGRKDG